jgi:hypothetical protein
MKTWERVFARTFDAILLSVGIYTLMLPNGYYGMYLLANTPWL